MSGSAAAAAASNAGEAERLCQEAHALMAQHQYQKALPLFEKAAELGSADAQFAVGASFDNEGPEGSFVKAREYYAKAAAQNHTDALLQLGVLHWRGEGGEKDYAQAMDFFKRAADLNNAEAQFNLAVMHMRGEGVTKSESESLEWCTKAANGGHAMAQYHLSTLYEAGTGGVERSVEKQKEWLRKAAAQGFMRAQMHLRQIEAMDMDPKNVPTEEQLDAMPADELFSTGMAALQSGGIVHGVNCLQKAAAKGEVNAMMLLSQLHRAGRFVAQSDARAFELMKQAADKNHPQAKHGLADFYMKGVATDKDVKKAIQLLREAATASVLPAQLALVNLYEKGFESIVEPNIAEMQLWLALAAEGGHPLAQMKFAVLYFEGKTGPTGDVPQNYEKAAHWFNKAAVSGVPDAYLALADMYADGLGVEKSEEKSNEYKQRAQTMMMMRGGGGGHGHGHGGHGHSHGGGAHGHSHGGQPCHGHGGH